MRRAAEVAPKCLLRSLVKKKKRYLKVALMRPNLGKKEGKKKRNRKEYDRSDRGGGCLHVVTGLCPSYGQAYYTAARPVPCNVLCNVLATLQVTFSVTFLWCLQGVS